MVRGLLRIRHTGCTWEIPKITGTFLGVPDSSILGSITEAKSEVSDFCVLSESVTRGVEAGTKLRAAAAQAAAACVLHLGALPLLGIKYEYRYTYSF